MPSPHQPQNNVQGIDSLSEVLRQESERLRELAEACQKREEYEAEMRANYPHFKRFVYDTLRREFLGEAPELLEDKDLLTIIQEGDGKPLEAFIDKLERPLQGK